MGELALAIIEITKDTSESGVGVGETATDNCCCGGDRRRKIRVKNVLAIVVGLFYIIDIAMDTAAVKEITDTPPLVHIPINASNPPVDSSCLSLNNENTSMEFTHTFRCYNTSVVAVSRQKIRTAYYALLGISWSLFVAEMVTFVLFALIPIFCKRELVKVSRALIVSRLLTVCVALFEDIPLTTIKLWYAFSEDKYSDLTLIRVSTFVTFVTGVCKTILSLFSLDGFSAVYEDSTGKSLSSWVECAGCLQFFAEVCIAALSLATFINLFSLTTACECSTLV